MADWFERKPTLFDLVGGAVPTPSKTSLADIVKALSVPPPSAIPTNSLGSLFGYAPPETKSPFGSLAPTSPFATEFGNAFGYPAPKSAVPSNSLASLLEGYKPTETETPFGSLTPTFPFSTDLVGAHGYSRPISTYPSALPVAPRPTLPPQRIKRKVFFSFHFTDLLRVNNVRQTWKIIDPNMRGFYDRSLWESKKLEGAESLKRLIRTSMEHASTVCVLVGSETWSRRWVKYEIARSIVDKRGLLAVHINSLNHHHRRTPDQLGYNPLRLMGIYRAANGNFYLYENKNVGVNSLTGQTEWQWLPYEDFTTPVPLPRYMKAPDVGFVQPLNEVVDEYDFVADVGHKNIGAWIDRAAAPAGRHST